MRDNSVNYFRDHKNCGFTIIELIIVIILISIMAVTVVPKFLSSKGFEEYTYRDELITKLRAIQLRSMQQTNDTTCLQIQIEVTTIALLATDLDPDTPICKTTPAGEPTTITINDNHNVNFTISEELSSFSFSSLGKPVGCTAITPCEITLTVAGESSLAIKINIEGYIYAI